VRAAGPAAGRDGLGHFPAINPDDVPAHWPDERFDLIWVLVRQSRPALGCRFVCVPQMLLAYDVRDVRQRRRPT
jgi:hypothetical protein